MIDEAIRAGFVSGVLNFEHSGQKLATTDDTFS